MRPPRQGVDGAELPLVYSPAAIDAFWGRRPVAVASRALQLLRLGGGFFARLAWDFATGRLAETEVQRAVALRDIVTSLGPAFIKLGQARRPPRRPGVPAFGGYDSRCWCCKACWCTAPAPA